MQQVFMLVVGRLPDRKLHPFRRRKCELALENTPGVIDWCANDSQTLVFFGTRTHAEKAMEAMKSSGNPVADAIFAAEADYETHRFTVKGPLEG